MKQYKYKAKDWRRKVKHYWKALEIIEDKFYKELYELEMVMEKETGIKGIEFFWCDNSIVGIGNGSRTMELIQRR